jgi:hypothetical protein
MKIHPAGVVLIQESRQMNGQTWRTEYSPFANLLTRFIKTVKLRVLEKRGFFSPKNEPSASHKVFAP